MSTLAETAFSQVNDSCAAFYLDRLQSYRLSGPDAIRYAHGRLTQNVRDLPAAEARKFMLITAQGKVQALGSIARFEDDLLIACEAKQDVTFSEAFLQFKVADQLELTRPTECQHAFLLIGTSAEHALQKLFPKSTLSIAHTAHFASEQLHLVPAMLGALPSVYILCGESALDPLKEALRNTCDIEVYDTSEFETTRITLGIPSAARELEEKCIATDYPHDAYISFSKGCYTGQEVVEMSSARGRPNRRLIGVRIKSESAPEIGAELRTEAGRCGRVSSSVYLPQAQEVRCLAFIKNSVEPGTPLLLEGLECQVIFNH